MKNLSETTIFVKKNYKLAVSLFFIVYFFIGINIFKDYGISVDESVSRANGVMSLKYVVHGDQGLFASKERYHGPAFEILLVTIESILNLTPDPRALFLLRHLVTFLLFYISLLFFYLLVRNRFKSWKMGLLGCSFLIVSPRIFAHSFYNSKDLAFLSFFIISIYTMIRYLDKKTLFSAFLHAFICALLIDVRVLGVVVPFFTMIFMGIDLLAIMFKEKENKQTSGAWRIVMPIIANFFEYIVLLSCFIVVFWPALWPNPLNNFIRAFLQMSQYPYWGTVLYLGKYIKATNLPWHYIPVWLIISTPVLYSVCFFIGCFIVMKSVLKNPMRFFFNKRKDFLYILWFFFPLVTVIAFKSVLYDEWRQMFFIYPAFLMLALIGLRSLFEYFRIKFQGLSYKIVNISFIIIVTINLINIVKFMAKNHPFQNVYFNSLAGRNMKEAKSNFELDYWGLSYRQALEYILKTDTDSVIKIYVAYDPGINAQIIRAPDRERLVYVKNIEEAKYFLSNYRWHKEEFPYQEEYYAIKVNGVKIMVVYRLN